MGFYPFSVSPFVLNSYPGSFHGPDSAFPHPTYYSLGESGANLVPISVSSGSDAGGGQQIYNGVAMGSFIPFSNPLNVPGCSLNGGPIGNWPSGWAALASVGIQAIPPKECQVTPISTAKEPIVSKNEGGKRR